MKAHIKYPYAGYAYTYMYAARSVFEATMRQSGLVSGVDYSLDVNVNGNVVTWDFLAGTAELKERFIELTAPQPFEKTVLENAVKLCALDLGKTVSHVDYAKLKEDLVIGEISNKPLLRTNAILSNPALEFGGNDIPRITYISFSNPDAITDIYIFAVAEQLSILHPDSLVKADQPHHRIKIYSHQVEEYQIDQAIENLKPAGLDEKIAKRVCVKPAEVANALKSITLTVKHS